MSFSENLQYLRKRDKITQEELADRLGVSRQSVSKWETGEAYPETEKLIALCDMFDVSLDALMRTDITECNARDKCDNTKPDEPVQEQPCTDKTEYCKRLDSFSFGISLGVFMILFGVAVCILLAAISQTLAENAKKFTSIMSGVAVLLFVAVAVFVFIVSGISYDRFRKEHPVMDNVFEERKIAAFTRRFGIMMACFVSGILLDVIFVVVMSALIDSEVLIVANADAVYSFVASAFMCVLAFLVSGIVYLGIQHSKYNVAEYNRQTAKETNKSQKSRFTDALCGAVMLSATALYLIMGFVWKWWHPGWIVFPVGGIVCAILSSLRGAKDDNDKDK